MMLSVPAVRQGSPATAGQLLDLLWTTLSDLLGSAATATLLRRSKKALPADRELAGLQINRSGLEYTYVIPPEWRVESEESLAALRELVNVLSPILRELTGSAVIRYLDNHPEFRANGILFS